MAEQKYPQPYPGTRPDFGSGPTVAELLQKAADQARPKRLEDDNYGKDGSWRGSTTKY